MTQARIIAGKLRDFMNQQDNQFTLSDLRRGMVILSNGKLRGEGRKRDHGALSASTPGCSVFSGVPDGLSPPPKKKVLEAVLGHIDAEHCAS
jgi:hypothetical protein